MGELIQIGVENNNASMPKTLSENVDFKNQSKIISEYQKPKNRVEEIFNNVKQRNLKILLVMPKFTYSNPTQKKSYHYSIPIGMCYISSVLKKAGFDVDCLNMNHIDGSVTEILKRALDRKDYDVFCTGHTGIGFGLIENVIELVHKHKSKPKFILGGDLVTSEPELMTNELDFDFAIVGEGELTIVDLLDCIENDGNFNEIDGICFKKEGKAIVNTRRKPLEGYELDSLPYPDLDGFEFEKIINNMACNDAFFNIHDYPRVYPILGGRGCALKCSFCYHSTGNTYKLRSLDNMIDEMRYAIEKYNANCFHFMEDLFNLKKERMIEFCHKIQALMKETNTELSWICQMWVGGVDRETLKLMKESGLAWACFGIESFSSDVLKSMNKPISPDQIKNVLYWLKELDMRIMGNFIFGDIAETTETAKETLDFYKEHCDGQYNLYFIQQYPGSKIFNYSVEKGLIKDKKDFIRNQMHHTVLMNMTEKMTDEEFKKLRKEVFDTRKKYVKHVIPSKIKKTDEDIYEITVDCPYCKETCVYKNCFFHDIKSMTSLAMCRHCPKHFFFCNWFYKLSIDHYESLEFVRKIYLYFKDKILIKNYR